jgi:hypothetical protein
MSDGAGDLGRRRLYFDLVRAARFAIAERTAAFATLVLTAFLAMAVRRALFFLFVLAAFIPAELADFAVTIYPTSEQPDDTPGRNTRSGGTPRPAPCIELVAPPTS